MKIVSYKYDLRFAYVAGVLGTVLALFAPETYLGAAARNFPVQLGFIMLVGVFGWEPRARGLFFSVSLVAVVMLFI